MMHTESLQDEWLLRLIMVRHLPLRAPFCTATPCPAEGGTTSPYGGEGLRHCLFHCFLHHNRKYSNPGSHAVREEMCLKICHSLAMYTCTYTAAKAASQRQLQERCARGSHRTESAV
jgi:hypothetical protein